MDVKSWLLTSLDSSWLGGNANDRASGWSNKHNVLKSAGSADLWVRTLVSLWSDVFRTDEDAVDVHMVAES